MHERKPTPPPSGNATMMPVVGESQPDAPGAKPAASWDRETRVDSLARYGRLLEAAAEYGRTVALLRSVVSRLVPSRLPTSGRDRGQSGTDGKNASRLGMEDCPNE